MARVQDINIIARNTYAWQRLVDFCESNYDFGDIEGFKSEFGCGAGYDVGYDKASGYIYLINKNQTDIVPTHIHKNDIGF